MHDATLRVLVDGQEEHVVSLPAGVDVVVGSAPHPGDVMSVVVDADGVSRRHVRLRAADGGVDVEDLGSTYHTLLEDGVAITRWQVLRPTRLTVGDATLVVEPAAAAGEATVQRRPRVVTRDAQRRTLVALCRDHVVHPRGRGCWVLSYRDLEALFAGRPKADQFSEDVQNLCAQVGISTSAESLIDWAVATREVGPEDAAWLDAVLRDRTGMTYEQRIREIPRFAWLRSQQERARGA